ncbi:MAG: hypothetical protein PWR06_603, partial [Thermoanaerobacteraceae bacterium]|nr:hypothetical protein [Thermoanaerobacteraceae bacterium]
EIVGIPKITGGARSYMKEYKDEFDMYFSEQIKIKSRPVFSRS